MTIRQNSITLLLFGFLCSVILIGCVVEPTPVPPTVTPLPSLTPTNTVEATATTAPSASPTPPPIAIETVYPPPLPEISPVAYPPPVTTVSEIGGAEQAYPAPTVGAVAGAEPIPTAENAFRLTLPLSVGDTQIRGFGPPNIDIAIIDISVVNLLGKGQSSADGSFTIEVPPLEHNHLIGLSPDITEKEIPMNELLQWRGQGYRNIPNVGVFLVTAFVE